MLFDTGNRRHHGSLSVARNRNRLVSSASIYDNLTEETRTTTTTTTKAVNGDVS
jgi:hypothetical protein